jgi:hypothetical protein
MWLRLHKSNSFLEIPFGVHQKNSSSNASGKQRSGVMAHSRSHEIPHFFKNDLLIFRFFLIILEGKIQKLSGLKKNPKPPMEPSIK